jgi:ATP-dependent RNA helicase RhlE
MEPCGLAQKDIFMISDTKTPITKTSGFARFHLAPSILRGVESAGFNEPRPVQAATIPAGLEGLDVLGLAQTGTGKTAAFALPILERLLDDKSRGIRALILAPTRELARQIDAEIRLLAKFTRVTTATVFGGVPIAGQIRNLARKPQIIVACPGRLLDLHNQRAVDLSGVATVVIDEADHMLDMGFLPDIRRILNLLPARRQNMMFSATMPHEIRSLADRILHKPHVVELNHSRPPETIEHAVYPVAEKSKLDLLQHLLSEDGFVSAIVFTRTKHRARRIADKLVRSGRRAVALQGNMSQGQRDRAMKGFREGRSDILVATDIAARGIDVDDVSHVINFDIPNTPDAYTHRIGRTGRAESQGKAATFVTLEDRSAVSAIERKIGKKISRRVINGFEDVASFDEPRKKPAPSPRNSFRSRRSRPRSRCSA